MEQVNQENFGGSKNEKEVNPKAQEVAKKINQALVEYDVRDSEGNQITVEAVDFPSDQELAVADKIEAIIQKYVPENNISLFTALLQYIRANTIVYAVKGKPLNNKKDLIPLKKYASTVFLQAKNSEINDEERVKLSELFSLYDENRLRRHFLSKAANAAEVLSLLYPTIDGDEDLMKESQYVHSYAFPTQTKNEHNEIVQFSPYEDISVEDRIAVTKRAAALFEETLTRIADEMQKTAPKIV